MRVQSSTKHIISITIICLLLFSVAPSVFHHSFDPSVNAASLKRLLGSNFYFHRELSGIGSYRILNTAYPTYSDSKSIVQTVPTGVWEVGDGWISPQVPENITLERAYNFLFSVWGAGSGNASLFFKFFAYRNDIEHFLFASNPSERLIRNTFEMLWQHKTKEVTLQINEGDRLVLRLFINVTVAGTFGLGYDCTQYPSYVNDPVETRYFRSDLVFGTSQTTTGAKIAKYHDPLVTGYWGIRVWHLVGGVETEITSGTPNATVSRSVEGSGIQSNTWDCPETSLTVNDQIVVRVYFQAAAEGWQLLQTFTSEVLGAGKLDAATWTVYYYTRIVWITGTTYEYDFYHGSSFYNSRVTNFSWSVPAVDPPPTYSNISVNATVAGQPCKFSVLWADETNVSGFIFRTNNTGSWINDTWTSTWSGWATTKSAWANVTKTLNSTIGLVVSYQWLCNDTINGWNSTTIQNLTTTSDTTPPTYSDVGTNTTNAGRTCLFYAKWADNVALKTFIFGTNNSGLWINDTAVAFTANPDWSNATKVLNATIGLRVEWRIWVDDTNNNLNDTGLQYLITSLTNETRCFRTDIEAVNGLSARKLLTTNTDSSSQESHAKAGNVIAAGATTGIRVWQRTSDGNETELTSAVPVAEAFWNTSTFSVTINGTWLCPWTALASTDSIVVRVYGKFGSDAYVMYGSKAWSTEQLNAQSLNSTIWTVFYCIELWFDSSSDVTWHDFDFGSSFRNSRIMNFTWTPAAAPKIWNVVAAWSFSLIARLLQSVATWSFTLLTKIWNDLPTWSFTLTIMEWFIISAWQFSLIVRQWMGIETFFFSVSGLGWHFITLWIVLLQPPSRSGLLLIATVIGVILSLGFVRVLGVKKRKTT